MAKVACALAMLCGLSALADGTGVAQGKLIVTARVVQSARVELVEVPDATKARQLNQGREIEWTVPVRASVEGKRSGASVELRGCKGSARWSGGKVAIEVNGSDGASQIKAVVKNDPSCSPTVLVTILPDGAPPRG